MNQIRISPASGVSDERAPLSILQTTDMLDGQPGIGVIAPYDEVLSELDDARPLLDSVRWAAHWRRVGFHAQEIRNASSSGLTGNQLEICRKFVFESYLSLREIEMQQSPN